MTCPRCKGPAPIADHGGHKWWGCVEHLSARLDAIEEHPALSVPPLESARGAGRDVPGGSRELAPEWERLAEPGVRADQYGKFNWICVNDVCGRPAVYGRDEAPSGACEAHAAEMGVFAPAPPAPAESPSEAAPGDVVVPQTVIQLEHTTTGNPSPPVAVAPSEAPKVEPPGLYRKFTVTRTDGSSGHWGKHERCDYFVLDWVHDKFAPVAALAYADACQSEYPELAADLRKRASSCRDAGRPVRPATKVCDFCGGDAEPFKQIDAAMSACATCVANVDAGRPVNAAGGGDGLDMLGELKKKMAQPAASPAPCPGCGRAIEQDAVDHGCRVVTEAGVRVVRCSGSGKVYPEPSPPTDPSPSGAVAPVTSKEAREALEVIDEARANRQLAFAAKVKLMRYINERSDRESVEAALRERATAAEQHSLRLCKDLAGLHDERDALRAELARLGDVLSSCKDCAMVVLSGNATAPTAAPAGTGANRERACEWTDCHKPEGHHTNDCDSFACHLDEAESRGRDAALAAIPEVAAWRALSDTERSLALGVVERGADSAWCTGEVKGSDIARRVLEALTKEK
jgi:hypothetical protein